MVRTSTERPFSFWIGCASWLCLCIVLIRLDLGVLAFMGSLFLSIYFFGLRDKFASETTASAYSVFNRKGQAIPGGFTGEQLDRQLRFAPQRGAGNQDEDENVSGFAQADAENEASKTVPTNSVPDQERIRRRNAAAAAAERRSKSSSTA